MACRAGRLNRPPKIRCIARSSSTAHAVPSRQPRPLTSWQTRIIANNQVAAYAVAAATQSRGYSIVRHRGKPSQRITQTRLCPRSGLSRASHAKDATCAPARHERQHSVEEQDNGGQEGADTELREGIAVGD